MRDVACVLVTLPGGRVTAVSASVPPLLGADGDELVDRPLSALMRGLWRSEPMRLLVSEAQHGFACPTTVRVADGRLVPCSVAVRHVRTPERRWAFIVIDAEGATRSGGALLHLSDAEDVVLGVGDGDGGVADISPNVERLIGVDAATIVSRPVAGLFHADDYANFMATGSAAVSAERTAAVAVRMRHADGRWIPVRLFLAPIGAGRTARLAFAIAPDIPRAAAKGEVDAVRLEAVEQRLRRIALEIAALGITDGVAMDVPPDVAVALGQLSPKRQEIVARLQAGDRVPTIAEAMFLSQSTIRNHLSATFRHFGVSSQEELVRLLRGLRPDGRDAG